MMKLTVVVILVSVVVVASAFGTSNRELENAWKHYTTSHQKNYHPEEEALRKEIFKSSMIETYQHNSNASMSYEESPNAFTDMADEEIENYTGYVEEDDEDEDSRDLWRPHGVATRSLPSFVDHRASSCMQSIKNQGSCGSCWAFGAIAPLEFAQCQKYKTPVTLSEQQLIDCSKRGCNGGSTTGAWTFLMKNGGSNIHSLYGRYEARERECRFKPGNTGARVKQWNKLDSTPTAMMEALANNYILFTSIRVVRSFARYSEGVYDANDCDGQPNHAVNVVGYGRLYGTDYWLIRNSWGSRWGMGGYIRMRRGINLCRVETKPRTVDVV